MTALVSCIQIFSIKLSKGMQDLLSLTTLSPAQLSCGNSLLSYVTAILFRLCDSGEINFYPLHQGPWAGLAMPHAPQGPHFSCGERDTLFLWNLDTLGTMKSWSIQWQTCHHVERDCLRTRCTP